MERLTNRVRTVVADDEALARATVERLLAPDPEIELCASCRDGRDALAAIEEHRPDLLFLDIQMPEMDGFTMLETLRKTHGLRTRLPFVVFVTAFDRFALRAFEVHAIDYLLKPFGDDRFYRALEHAKEQLAIGGLQGRLRGLLDSHESAGAVAPSERFAVKTRSGVKFLDYSTIVWFEAADHYVLVHTESGSHIIRESMKNLEASVDPERFLRIHRGTIINTEHIEELAPCSGDESELRLSTGKRLRVSRRRYRQLRSRLGI